jgi:predicted methyltransferase
MKHSNTAIAWTVAAILFAGGAVAATRPAPLSPADYAAILNDPARTEADKKDDAARKPAEVLAFAQVRPGDTVMELEVGRGWYTDILSGAVGTSGKVITQNPPEFDYSPPAMATRRAAGRLKNVTDTSTHFDALQAPSGSVDKVLWILGPHELYYVPKDTKGLGDPAKAYAEIMRVLKPGGTFIAMDHAANAGAAPATTGQEIHRIDPAVVLASAKAAGFVLDAKSEVLANPTDDRTKMVFDASVRRHTDQFLFRFRKPS